MIKHYCDKCEKLISGKEYMQFEIILCGFEEVNKHVCEDCFEKIMEDFKH